MGVPDYLSDYFNLNIWGVEPARVHAVGHHKIDSAELAAAGNRRFGASR
jgi:hypothetical protein